VVYFRSWAVEEKVVKVELLKEMWQSHGFSQLTLVIRQTSRAELWWSKIIDLSTSHGDKILIDLFSGNKPVVLSLRACLVHSLRTSNLQLSHMVVCFLFLT
jgi:hypothetical protein